MHHHVDEAGLVLEIEEDEALGGAGPLAHHHRSRLAKAQADTRTMASAIGAFQAHMGQMPAVLGDLTVAQTNVLGQVSGPFMAGDAVPPVGWTYNYSPGGSTGYTITASGDNTSLTLP